MPSWKSPRQHSLPASMGRSVGAAAPSVAADPTSGVTHTGSLVLKRLHRRCLSWVTGRHAQLGLRGPLVLQHRILAITATGLLFRRLYGYTPYASQRH